MLTRRTLVEIVHEILRGEPRKKTHIMYETGLSYPQVVRYLRFLTERGLVDVIHEPDCNEKYAPTVRGQELARHLDAVTAYLGLGGQDA